MYRLRFHGDRGKKARDYAVKAKVRLYSGESGSWHFLTVPKGTSAAIKREFGHAAKGWGSLPVAVTLGGTTWSTSIFPDRKAGAYLLPLKAEVRRREGVRSGGTVSLRLSIVR